MHCTQTWRSSFLVHPRQCKPKDNLPSEQNYPYFLSREEVADNRKCPDLSNESIAQAGTDANLT